VIVSIAILGALFLFFLKLRSIPSLRQKIYLGLLRFSAIAIVFAVYLNPTIIMQEVERIKTTVVVLVDASSSTRIQANGEITVEDMIKRFFQKNGAYFEQLEKTNDVRYFAFGGNIVRTTRDEVLSSGLPLLGSTDIQSAIEKAIEGVESLGGAIIITDTLHETLVQSMEKCLASLPEPTLLLLADASPELPYVAITKIKGDALLLSRNRGEIDIPLFALTNEKVAITVALLVDGKMKVAKAIEVSPQQTTYSVSFPVFFDAPGRHFLEVRAISGSREFSRVYEVLDVARDNIRVMHLAGAPSWDVHFLREYLRSRSDIETISFYTLLNPFEDIIPSDQETVLIPFPTETLWSRDLKTSDILVLHDYKGEEDEGDMLMTKGVKDFVQSGGGLLIVSGDSAPLGPRPLRDIPDFLPVSVGPVYQQDLMEGQWQPRIADKENDNIIVSRNNLPSRIQYAPKVSSLVPIDKVLKDATVLVEAVDKGKGLPLVVAKEYGQGRICMVLTDTLWRLSFDQDSREIYTDLLDDLIGYLTKDPRFMPVVVKVSKDRFEPMEEARFRVMADGGIKGLEARILFLNKNGEFEEIERTEVTGNEMTFVGREHGLYSVVIEGQRGGHKIKAMDYFVVGSSIDEMKIARNDVSQIVTSLGGKGLMVQTIENASLRGFKPKTEIKRTGGVKARTPIGLGLVNLLCLLLLLSLEWFLEWRLLRHE
jgi:hypothetical protein